MELGFETKILLQRILLPFALATLGGMLISRRQSNRDGGGELTRRGAGWTFLGTCCIAISPILSDLWQRELLWRPREWGGWSASEPWMWMIWIVPGSMLLLGWLRWCFPSATHFAVWLGPCMATLFAGGLYCIVPQGSGYTDKLGEAVLWVAAGTIASFWNAWAIDGIAKGPGGRWAPLVMVAQLGCVASLALQSYALLGEWGLVGVALAMGLSVGSLAFAYADSGPMGWPLATVMVPLVWMGVGCLAVSHFYVSSPPNIWLVGAVLMLPTVVGLWDRVLHRQSPWVRAFVAAVVSGMILGLVIVTVLQNQPEW
jgi:hypothetical protein